MRVPEVSLVSVILAGLSGGCAPAPEGLRATPDGTGPMIRIDWDAEPLPDIPFPNDLASRPDPTSPTGLRLNLPEHADVQMEALTRQRLNELTGFGTFSMITVGFDAPLDLDALLAAQAGDVLDEASFRDDAVLLIDVDPASPGFGRPVALDFATGRFPSDATTLGTFLPNDPRADQPHLLWETGEEDLDGDGVLDPGEDTDGDGLLDHPNVWPPGGDPRFDVLTFYDLQTDDLVLRPVVPLREETRYALVLTEDLIGRDGQPVRSPWAWVHHTRQTEALRPVIDTLASLGRDVDDLAYAWTFTTGSTTRELWEVAEGLRGRGPFASLGARFPAGVTKGHELHVRTDLADPLTLPAEMLLEPLSDLPVLPEDLVGPLLDVYQLYASDLVGGTIVSPDLMYDRDDGGHFDADEVWRLDRNTGWIDAQPREIAFTCVLPKATADHQPPWPVAIHAHGYGSTRVDFLAFAYGLTRTGVAVCALDAQGHGLPDLGEFDDLVQPILSLTGTDPLFWHLDHDRLRDLDNDGIDDPAGDQYSADAFHTRDMIRQPVIDVVQLVRSLRACGTAQMDQVRLTEQGPFTTGRRLSCDFDNDGAPDLGGPDVPFMLHGVSQGGIMTSLSTAVVDDLQASVLTVPGGGLVDIAGRTDISRVADGMVGRALSPLIIGEQLPDGWRLSQVAVSVDHYEVLPIATLDAWPEGGSVVVRNLDLDRESRGLIPADGRVRVPIAANAPDAAQRARLAQIPPEGAGEDDVYTVDDNVGLGDRLEIEVLDASGQPVQQITRWAHRGRFEGVTHQRDTPLFAAGWGLGLRRGSADLRKTIAVLSMAVEAGDPISYARRWFDEPYGDPVPVLIHLTTGDTTVPIATGISLARAAGMIDTTTIDPRYGTTVDRWLVDNHVIHGVEEYGPWQTPKGTPLLFDPDDLDEDTDGWDAPSDAPLRATLQLPSGASAGLRFLYVEPRGTHAYITPDASAPFDVPHFGAMQMAWFLSSGGELRDDPCLATPDCPFLPPPAEAP